jgi:hypothetical protein
MTSPSSIPTNDLVTALDRIGLTAVSQNLDDLLARTIKARWSPHTLLEEICRLEECERARRSLERRLQSSRIGRFKLMADFDWNWPTEIDRDLIERSLTLDFVREGRNLVLVGNNGLGKTMIAKNIAHAAVLAGYSVLFRSTADILDEDIVMGVSTGIYLAQSGHNVTLLTSRKETIPGFTQHYPEYIVALSQRLKNFSPITEATVTGISEGKVTYKDAKGSETFIQADSVVISVGRKPRYDEALKFYGSASRVLFLGDCSDEGGNIQRRTRSAYFAASQI